MEANFFAKIFNRRQMLRGVGILSGGALAARLFPGAIVRTAEAGFPQEKSPADQVAAMRAQFGRADSGAKIDG